jgi:hypothetical protein
VKKKSRYLVNSFIMENMRNIKFDVRLNKITIRLNKVKSKGVCKVCSFLGY